jgi:3'(2'), 5'-bisphosphate nucleotidase
VTEFDPPTFRSEIPPAAAATDDHVLAGWLATTAGRRLLDVRREGLTGRDLKDAGDQAAHVLLMELLAEHRPGDAVLSEEGADDRVRLTADRVWIVDPLDGTREFSEPPREDWAVHVALWERGVLVAGAVAQPALGETFSTAAPPSVPPRTSERPRIAVSRTRPPAFVEALAAEIGAELVPMGSAGVKVISVTRDVTDAYVHAGGQYEWDNAAPVALQPGERLPARPDRVSSRVGRPDPRLRAAPRHRLTARYLNRLVPIGCGYSLGNVLLFTRESSMRFDGERSRVMWDTVHVSDVHLSHDRPCVECGHALHTFLPCSDTCSCGGTLAFGTASQEHGS